MTSVKLINHSSSTADWNKLILKNSRFSKVIFYKYVGNALPDTCFFAKKSYLWYPKFKK